MRAIGIAAGPRKGQLTDRLTDSVLKGLADRGAGTEKVSLSDFVIKPCAGCLACQKLGRCVINDDFNNLADKVRQSDVIVFASPTYFSNVTSSAKAFFDRGYSMFKAGSFGPVYRFEKPKKAILITSCVAPFPFSSLFGISGGSIRAMKVFFNYMRVATKTFIVSHATDFDDKKYDRLLRKAYDVGKNV